ncbi:hypothetical protein VPHK469_0096 [Vibrio phage K469]
MNVGFCRLSTFDRLKSFLRARFLSSGCGLFIDKRLLIIHWKRFLDISIIIIPMIIGLSWG